TDWRRDPSFGRMSDAPDPGVDDDVEEVDQDVHHDEGDRDDERHALDEEDVVAGDAVEDELSHGLDVEDDLDDHGAAHEVADAQAQHRDRGDQGVAQHVAGDDDGIGDAGADGGAHVVAVQLLDHRGADHAGEGAGHGDRQRDRGQGDVAQIGGGVLEEPDPAGHQGGEDAPAAGDLAEPLDHQDREPERRGGESGDRQHADHLVDPAVAEQGGEHAEDRGEHDRDGETEEGQLQRDREGAGDHLGDGHVSAGGAEVAAQHPAEEGEVAQPDRVVQAVVLPVQLQRLGGGRLPEREPGGVRRRERHDDEDEQGDAEDHQRQGEQSSPYQADELGHAVLRGRARGRGGGRA